MRGTWAHTGKEEGGAGKRTVIFNVHYLGQCGGGFSRKVTRKIEIKEIQTLDDLHEAIIYKSFEWVDRHMYSFFFDNVPYSKDRRMEYSCLTEEDPFDGARPNPTSTKLNKLNLKKGKRFLFVFDFGDDHRFGIEVDGFGKVTGEKRYPLMLEEKGKAPKQYY